MDMFTWIIFIYDYVFFNSINARHIIPYNDAIDCHWLSGLMTSYCKMSKASRFHFCTKRFCMRSTLLFLSIPLILCNSNGIHIFLYIIHDLNSVIVDYNKMNFLPKLYKNIEMGNKINFHWIQLLKLLRKTSKELLRIHKNPNVEIFRTGSGREWPWDKEGVVGDIKNPPNLN